MLRLGLEEKKRKGYQVLCMGAHSDDIEIGCGGTILELLRTNRDLEVHWAVFSSGPEREAEARRSAELFLTDAAKKHVYIMNFRGSFFPYEGLQIKQCFEDFKDRLSPDLIFTHMRDDRHQEHRIINEFTWNTWRNHLILEYEIPKYDGDLGIPNFFVPFDHKVCQRKIKYLMNCFKSQSDKQWFTRDTFQGLMRIRGIEANSPGKFAEAYYSRKLVLGV